MLSQWSINQISKMKIYELLKFKIYYSLKSKSVNTQNSAIFKKETKKKKNPTEILINYVSQILVNQKKNLICAYQW